MPLNTVSNECFPFPVASLVFSITVHVLVFWSLEKRGYFLLSKCIFCFMHGVTNKTVRSWTPPEIDPQWGHCLTYPPWNWTWGVCLLTHWTWGVCLQTQISQDTGCKLLIKSSHCAAEEAHDKDIYQTEQEWSDLLRLWTSPWFWA